MECNRVEDIKSVYKTQTIVYFLQTILQNFKKSILIKIAESNLDESALLPEIYNIKNRNIIL